MKVNNPNDLPRLIEKYENLILPKYQDLEDKAGIMVFYYQNNNQLRSLVLNHHSSSLYNAKLMLEVERNKDNVKWL